jgi:hypothetical protein
MAIAVIASAAKQPPVIAPFCHCERSEAI